MKSEDPVASAQCELQAKENMLFASTAIANGSCTAVITSTGMNVCPLSCLQILFALAIPYCMLLLVPICRFECCGCWNETN